MLVRHRLSDFALMSARSPGFKLPILAIPAILAISFVFLRVLCGSLFRSPDVPITRSPDLFEALCLRPSARHPPPIDVLLITKGKPQFDRAVTERSKLVFCVFKPSNQLQFQPFFSVSTVRSAEGRKP
jgi:hypothetical protein